MSRDSHKKCPKNAEKGRKIPELVPNFIRSVHYFNRLLIRRAGASSATRWAPAREQATRHLKFRQNYALNSVFPSAPLARSRRFLFQRPMTQGFSLHAAENGLRKVNAGVNRSSIKNQKSACSALQKPLTTHPNSPVQRSELHCEEG